MINDYFHDDECNTNFASYSSKKEYIWDGKQQNVKEVNVTAIIAISLISLTEEKYR